MDWETVSRLVAEALPLDATRRAALLERECLGREEVRAEVLSLLAAHERAGTFLDTGDTARNLRSADGGVGEALVGTKVGLYQLLAVVGHGGMGVVYRAARTDPPREVALKLLHAASDPGAVARRFQAEQQVLARFDHPYIARLLDAGTSDGRPWFVMELVVGHPIDRHCAERRLDLRARLALFLKLCEAVAYAHGRLVVHRDIKPTNVLVSDTGDPKLLDFGIARLLDAAAQVQATESGLLMMTPQYASPEQVRGEPASVATDVHALGLLLHLLLTGRSAFRLHSPSAEELVRVVCLEEPPSPSTAVAAARPGDADAFEPPEPPARLARLLRGDLDAIVARALRKEVERRYASVEQLAADVRRHLDGQPVVARGGRLRYRAGKFLRRQRVPVALGVALFAALVAGLFATAWQVRVAAAEKARAERRFADVRRLATRFLFDFHDAIRDQAGSTKARELVVQTAVEYLDGLAGEAGDDLELRRELATGYARLAEVQGGVGMPSLGERAAAERSLGRALDLLRATRPADGRGLAQLALLHHRLAWVLAKDRRGGQARPVAEEAVRIARRATPLLPRVKGHLQEAQALAVLGAVLGADGDTLGQVAALEEALACLDRLSPSERQAPQARFRTMATLGALSDALANGEDPRGALEAIQRAVEMARAELARVPASASAHRVLAVNLSREGRVWLNLDRPERALPSLVEALALVERIAAHDAEDFQARVDVAVGQQNLCDAYTQAGELARARAACREYLRRAESLVSGPAGSADLQWNLVVATERMGHLERRAGRPALALRHYRRAVSLARPLAHSAEERRDLASGYVDLAAALADLGRLREAAWAARTAVDLLAEAAARMVREPRVRRELAEARERLADVLVAGAAYAGAQRQTALDEARHQYRAALDLYEALRREGRLHPTRTGRIDDIARRLRQAGTSERRGRPAALNGPGAQASAGLSAL